jgi:hypothetical protein
MGERCSAVRQAAAVEVATALDGERAALETALSRAHVDVIAGVSEG